MERPPIVTRAQLDTLPEGLYCLPDSDEGMWHIARVTSRQDSWLLVYSESFVRADGLRVWIQWCMQFPKGWIRLMDRVHVEETGEGWTKRCTVVHDPPVPVEYPAGL